MRFRLFPSPSCEGRGPAMFREQIVLQDSEVPSQESDVIRAEAQWAAAPPEGRSKLLSVGEGSVQQAAIESSPTTEQDGTPPDLDDQDADKRKAIEELKAALQKAVAAPPEALVGFLLCVYRRSQADALFVRLRAELPRIGAQLALFLRVKRSVGGSAGSAAAPIVGADLKFGPLKDRLKGQVKSYNTRKGFGFIELAGFSNGVFVYNSHLVGRIGLVAGETVEFELVYDQGRPQARRVKVVPSLSNKTVPLNKDKNPFSMLKQACSTPQLSPHDLTLAMAAAAVETPMKLPQSQSRPVRKSEPTDMFQKIREAQTTARHAAQPPDDSHAAMEPSARFVDWQAPTQNGPVLRPVAPANRVEVGHFAGPDVGALENEIIPPNTAVRLVGVPGEVNGCRGIVQSYGSPRWHYRVSVEMPNGKKVTMSLQGEFLQVENTVQETFSGGADVPSVSIATPPQHSPQPADKRPPGDASRKSANDALARFGHMVASNTPPAAPWMGMTGQQGHLMTAPPVAGKGGFGKGPLGPHAGSASAITTTNTANTTGSQTGSRSGHQAMMPDQGKPTTISIDPKNTGHVPIGTISEGDKPSGDLRGIRRLGLEQSLGPTMLSSQRAPLPTRPDQRMTSVFPMQGAHATDPSGDNFASEGCAGTRWIADPDDNQDFKEVIVREGPTLGSQQLRLINPGDVVEQKGPTQMVGGLLRMPILPEGWVTVHARRCNGPTFLVKYNDKHPKVSASPNVSHPAPTSSTANNSVACNSTGVDARPESMVSQQSGVSSNHGETTAPITSANRAVVETKGAPLAPLGAAPYVENLPPKRSPPTEGREFLAGAKSASSEVAASRGRRTPAQEGPRYSREELLEARPKKFDSDTTDTGASSQWQGAIRIVHIPYIDEMRDWKEPRDRERRRERRERLGENEDGGGRRNHERRERTLDDEADRTHLGASEGVAGHNVSGKGSEQPGQENCPTQ